jgi:hypothetical protein
VTAERNGGRGAVFYIQVTMTDGSWVTELGPYGSRDEAEVWATVQRRKMGSRFVFEVLPIDALPKRA